MSIIQDATVLPMEPGNAVAQISQWRYRAFGPSIGPCKVQGLTLRSPTGMIAEMIAGEWLTTRWMVMGHQFWDYKINYTLTNFDYPSTGILADDM